MSVTHRTLEGAWANCPTPDTCELRFHFEDIALPELIAAPFELLLPLFEAVDPPTDVTGTDRYWLNAEGFSHRDYDLPAVIMGGGHFEWWHDGYMHRDHDQPAYMDERGVRLWYQREQLHRVTGPAVINPTGGPVQARTRTSRGSWNAQVKGDEYWLRGQRLSHEDWLQVTSRQR